MKTRPLGVTIFAVLYIASGAVYSLRLVVLLLGAIRGNLGGGLVIPASFFTLFMGFSVCTGVGLLRLRHWARRLVLLGAWMGVVAIGCLFYSILLLQSMVDVKLSLVIVSYLMLLGVISWVGLTFWYFLRPSVKAQFKKQT